MTMTRIGSSRNLKGEGEAGNARINTDYAQSLGGQAMRGQKGGANSSVGRLHAIALRECVSVFYCYVLCSSTRTLVDR